MKFRKVIAFLLIAVTGLGVLTGCGLFTRNTQRMLGLTVAEVGEGADKEIITRRDLITFFYNNGGSDYVDQGYSVESVLTGFLDQLINRKVFLITARKNMTPVSGTPDKVGGYDITGYKNAKYLTAAELERIALEVDAAKHERLVNLEKEIEEDWNPAPSPSVSVSPSPSATPRPTPKPTSSASPAPSPVPTYPNPTSEAGTEEFYHEEDLGYEALLRYKRQIDAEFENEDVYTARQMETRIESKIIEKYYDKLYADVAAEYLTEAVMRGIFAVKLAAQKESYELDPSKYVSGITSQSEDTFLLFYPDIGGRYVFVKNLLIKFGDDAASDLSAAKSAIEDVTKYYELRQQQVAELLTAKDIRDEEEKEKDTEHTYGEYALDGDTYSADLKGIFFNYVLSEMNACATDAEKAARFAELIFAYGEDTGMFNNYFDYVVADAPQLGGSESFMKEFADAGRSLTAIGELSVCLTDYGYHILLCTDIVDAENTPKEEVYVHAERETPGTFSNRFYNSIYEQEKSERLNATQKSLSEQFEKDGQITKYLNNFSDLWKK